MLPLGQLALYIALGVSIALFILPLVGIKFRNPQLMYSARPLTIWLFVLVAFSFVYLGHLFWVSDFSFSYVFQNSNTKLPGIYKITAIWGGHEGSMLLWVLTLTLWMLAVVFYTRKMPLELSSATLAVLGGITVGFIAFLIFTSDPFARNLTLDLYDGRDLNPLLQDVGLIIHPPLLYMGYVGFAVPYAFMCAILLTGHIDRLSVRWVRPWALAAWGFLTLGITVGSWWAYYELGWGGWWFWDPVENASLIPWILGAALLHSLAATEKRKAFTLWTVIIAILTFCLSVLGTFLVRSGVLTSVHSFAADPSRGQFILFLLAIITLFAFLLLLFRSYKIRQESHLSLVSKESGILFNNIFLSVACFVVVLGTLYPLIVDILQIGKISVGEGYFNEYLVPISLLLLVVLGFTPLLRFKQDSFSRIKKPLSIMALLALIFGVGSSYLYAGQFDPLVVISLILSYWVFFGILFEIKLNGRKNDNFFQALKAQSLSRWGMNLGHLGLIVTIVGITLTSHYSDEQDRLVRVGETVQVREYGFELLELEEVRGSNYIGTKGVIQVYQNGKPLRMMYPEKRTYTVSGMPISEVALRPSLLDDLYVAMAEERAENAWAIRLYVKPFVRWIWLGGIIISIAALLSMLDRRYRIGRKQLQSTDNIELVQ
ncbi:heme lyase CcmF/NrfE family subunit [Ignatzschineria cameli]|uniref:C-type cytochrome biogenesis protein CcmF n=1 Tax=Ignatzschineria cameli TaxID=2182793 RepID=A0A2U2ARE3_9GAMM|nr:heme lyase CcmF/NrfE family subunit [Ignatzschineria cameli]PWD83508.1 c-type cytochrome biogenesis protein CcmF [Ignatzschineria cameli]PWD86833.1 c-type cytochrome biogenesis protein CcmF [Ignatzschineria cameli]PWD91807.1 c-type cytochrome biogenesis protein CcmF [Ignatzschineria cameli]PWD93607.1 c-type cytochrome biogenesis protein CcmF [Ignatzschineria cameli]PWD94349.1 c-type cytochrome biogenesis protein CcmF [Ignatzschineria cameli]